MEHAHPMEYTAGMEIIESDMLECVLDHVASYEPEAYTAVQVKGALARERLSPEDFGALMSGAAEPFLEEMARRAARERARYFGNSISLFTPLYISNYCGNSCVYCGFNCHNLIERGQLTLDEMDREMAEIAGTGLREVLLLTGEDRKMCGPEFLGKAIGVARKYFTTIGLEIYPANVEEYRLFRECGADFISVYQETYDIACYERVHPSGAKRSFPYRFYAQERALLAGMRGVAFGALLGLGDFRRDAYAAGIHAFLVQRKYPHGEFSFSVPRLRPYHRDSRVGIRESGLHTGEPRTANCELGERQVLQVMTALRIFMPYAGITVSTRERPGFRDHVIGMAATKISAGVKVGVGGHSMDAKGDEQFDIYDGRSVQEIRDMIVGRGFQCVFTDYIRV
ncbi:MAG: 2-iminoacetate synthase ThiH [Peptococcaceae bacterium]|nr:2-iminoacetate synthase ThiH [Peptococcaceae bacterium]